MTRYQNLTPSRLNKLAESFSPLFQEKGAALTEYMDHAGVAV
jgi:hypothetical protein